MDSQIGDRSGTAAPRGPDTIGSVPRAGSRVLARPSSRYLSLRFGDASLARRYSPKRSRRSGDLSARESSRSLAVLPSCPDRSAGPRDHTESSKFHRWEPLRWDRFTPNPERAGGHRRTERSAGRARSSWRRVRIPRRRGTRTSGEKPSRSPPRAPHLGTPPDRASPPQPHPHPHPRLAGSTRRWSSSRPRSTTHYTPAASTPRSSSSPGRSTAPGCSAAGIPTSTPTSAMPSPPCAGPSPRATSSAWSSPSRTTTPRRPTGRSRGSPSISSSATTTTQLAAATQLAG